MLEFLRRLFGPRTPPVEPQLDEALRLRMEADGMNLNAVVAEAAEPKAIPPKPALAGFQGRVRFEMTLGPEGTVKAVQMEGAPYDHVGELEAWAYAWTFKPAQLDGKPHACRMVYEVHWS